MVKFDELCVMAPERSLSAKRGYSFKMALTYLLSTIATISLLQNKTE